MTKIVAILPIKANSERIPGKNFKLFNGKPLFYWIVETLLSINRIDQIVINTDAKKTLLDLGLKESKRIKIRDRSVDICGDYVDMNKVIEDDISNIPSELYIMTHTTNPLLSAKTIIASIDAFLTQRDRSGVDSLFSVNSVQARFYDKFVSAINHNPDDLIPTQELCPLYEENSNLYIFTIDSFKEKNRRIGINPMMFETPKLESFDIDSSDDWTIAESVAKNKKM
jgi:CMP-N-acetylneuraminic acid synthetase